jgi:3-methyl-2-oxobutanoate hydroxymethyltransferase
MSYPPRTSALKFTVLSCLEKKQRGERIACLTAYDYAFARLLDESGVDVLLVGDSFGMVMAGYESTLPVGMDELVFATAAVRRATRRALVVADMPYGSYHLGVEETVRNGLRFVKQGGAEAVKLEGGQNRAALIQALVDAEIPVMGHIGLTPQSLNRLGGYRVQGREPEAVERLRRDAAAVEKAGAFSLVLEGIPRELAARITAESSIPTIGIGAGPDCDGQVLVLHDLLGISFDLKPKFVRRYADVASVVRNAAEAYRHDVESGNFPGDAESYHLPAQRSRTGSSRS